MQRLEPRSGCTGLAEALRDPSRAAASPTSAPSVDPMIERAAERSRILEAAVEEGLKKGALLAEQAIAEKVAAIELRLLEHHQAEVAALEAERQRLSALIRSIPDALHAMNDDVAAAVVEVAFCAAGRVIGQQWVERDVMADVCSRLIEEHCLSPATLRVAPDDVKRVSSAGVDVRIVADPQLVPGQCVIESAKGRLLTGLDVRLEAVRDALLVGIRSKSS